MNNRTSPWEILVKENNKLLLEGHNNSFSTDQIKRLTTIGKNMNVSACITNDAENARAHQSLFGNTFTGSLINNHSKFHVYFNSEFRWKISIHELGKHAPFCYCVRIWGRRLWWPDWLSQTNHMELERRNFFKGIVLINKTAWQCIH